MHDTFVSLIIVAFWPTIIALAIWDLRRDKKKKQNVIREKLEFVPETGHNSHFATDKEIKGAGCFDGGIPVGESQSSSRMVRFPASVRPHIAVFGGSGIGKSSYLERILLDDRCHGARSAIVWDPTYEHILQSHKWRRQFGRVFRWDPSCGFERELKDVPRVGISPMGAHWLNPKRTDFDSRCGAHGEAIIRKVDGANRYWSDSPRGMWTTFEMAQVMHGKPSDRNLSYIAREIVNGDIEGYANYMYGKTPDPDLRARLNRLRTRDKERPKSVDEWIETARTDSEFLLNRSIGKALSTPDITFQGFRREVQTLYINAPLEASNVFAPASRLLLGQMLAELFQGEEKGEVPVVVILDELYQYGKGLDILPAAFAAGRKYQVSILACMTSLADLRYLFPHDYDVVLKNLGMEIWLDADVADSEYLSKALGVKVENSYSKSINSSDFTITPFHANDPKAEFRDLSNDELRKIHVTHGYSQVHKPLLAPDEIRQTLGLREALVFIKECPFPMRLGRTPFYETSLASRALPSPFYRGRKGSSRNVLSKWMEG